MSVTSSLAGMIKPAKMSRFKWSINARPHDLRSSACPDIVHAGLEVPHRGKAVQPK